MTTATPTQHALARWLFTTELGTADGSHAKSTAAVRVFDKLSQRLAVLITPLGSEALVRRAVHLSRTEVSFLDGVQGVPTAESLITWLCERAATVEPSQAQDGFVTVLGNLVALLDLFIGERLAFRLLREVWPALPMTRPVQSTRQNGTGKLEANR